MKILPCVLITLYIISTISEIDCRDQSEECSNYNRKCTHHNDCCSGDCSYSHLWFHKYCRERHDFWFVVKTVAQLLLKGDKIETCTYKQKKPNDEVVAPDEHEKLEIKADLSKVPSQTTVIVKVRHKFLEVKVNDVGIKLNDSVLELSPKAAELLDIKSGDKVPCTIKIPNIHSIFLQNFWKYCYPFFVIYIYVLIT